LRPLNFRILEPFVLPSGFFQNPEIRRHPGDGADAVEQLRLLHGIKASGGKMLKALAVAGMIDARGRFVR